MISDREATELRTRAGDAEERAWHADKCMAEMARKVEVLWSEVEGLQEVNRSLRQQLENAPRAVVAPEVAYMRGFEDGSKQAGESHRNEIKHLQTQLDLALEAEGNAYKRGVRDGRDETKSNGHSGHSVGVKG